MMSMSTSQRRIQRRTTSISGPVVGFSLNFKLIEKHTFLPPSKLRLDVSAARSTCQLYHLTSIRAVRCRDTGGTGAPRLCQSRTACPYIDVTRQLADGSHSASCLDLNMEVWESGLDSIYLLFFWSPPMPKLLQPCDVGVIGPSIKDR